MSPIIVTPPSEETGEVRASENGARGIVVNGTPQGATKESEGKSKKGEDKKKRKSTSDNVCLLFRSLPTYSPDFDHYQYSY